MFLQMFINWADTRLDVFDWNQEKRHMEEKR